MKYQKSVWLSDKLGIEMSIDSNKKVLNVEWDPCIPTKKQFQAIQSKYREERDAFISEVARQSGHDAAVVIEI